MTGRHGNNRWCPFAAAGGWGIGAANLQLTAADLKEIANAIAHTGAGTGPTTP